MENPARPTILVVDDEIGALTLIGIMLERGGYQVVKAKDAQMALEVLDQITPCLITTDIMMPGMDGFELCKIIRQRPATQKTPIIIMSARSDADSIMRGFEAGANEYLPMPILHHDLVKVIRTQLATHGIVQDIPLSEQEILYLGIGQWNYRPIKVILPALFDKPESEWANIILDKIQHGDAKARSRAVIAALRWKEAPFKTRPAQEQCWKDIGSRFPSTMSGAEQAASHFADLAIVLMRPPEQVIEGLMALAEHPDADYRCFALRALMTERIPAVVPLAIHALKDKVTSVQVAAINVLAEMGTSEHTPLLIECLRSESSDVQRASANALAQFGNPAALDALTEALLGKRKYVPQIAAEVLTQFPKPELTDALLRAVDQHHDNHYLLAQIARALGKLEGEQVRAALQQLANHPESYVKHTAQSALKSLGEQHGN